MSEDANRYLEFLEQRTALLQSLSGALQAARAAVVSCDIAGFEARIAQQETLCQEIIKLDPGMLLVRQKCAVEMSLPGPRESREWDEKLRSALERSRVAGESVKRENECHQAVVRRSKRTVTALLNSFQTFEGNYEHLVHASPSNVSEPSGRI